jgi:hypothetical protein
LDSVFYVQFGGARRFETSLVFPDGGLFRMTAPVLLEATFSKSMFDEPITTRKLNGNK